MTEKITKITQAKIDALPDGVYTVESGLYLRVRGKYRNYFVRLQIDGKRRDVAVGSAKDVTLAAAKSKALALRAQAANGNEDWGKETVEKKAPLFKDFYPEAFGRFSSAKQWRSPHTGWQYEHVMKVYGMPKLAEKRVDEITRDDVLEVIQPIWEKINYSANVLRRLIELTLDYAAADGWTDKRNPAAWKGNLEMFLPPSSKVAPTRHHEAMTMDEARMLAPQLFWSMIVSHRALLFCLLTASRASEGVKARWEEFDFEKRIWYVPPERRKDGKPYPHRVPLSKQTICLLNHIPRNGEYVFISNFRGKNKKPIRIDQLRQILWRHVRNGVTTHGCRSTFRDWCAENGIDPILAEKSLMHTTGGRTEQAYQRSDLLEQRRPVMQAWADALFEGSGFVF